MIQILYGTGTMLYQHDPVHGVHLGTGDHEARAKALAAVISAHCSPINGPAIQKPGLDTIILWGHGDPEALCGLSADAMVTKMAEWKKWNPLLKTIEIITCNARHSTGGDLAYVQRFKPKLKSKYSDIVVKALPMGMGSLGAHSFSILLADANTRTWAYVTAGGKDNTEVMGPAQQEIKNEAANHGYNLVTAAAIIEKNNPMRTFGLKYGTFSDLRSNLQPV